MDPAVIRDMDSADPEPLSAAFTALGWDKPRSQFERYVKEHVAGQRVAIVAEVGDEPAGYVTVVWRSSYPPFADAGIPEIVDLNVLPAFRGRGIGNLLLDEAEATVRDRGERVGLGVGLYADYGAAQRIYARRGYVPDGRGVMYDNQPVAPGDTIRLDDAATLRLTKDLNHR